MFLTRCQRRYMIKHIVCYYGTNDRFPVLIESLVKQPNEHGDYRIGIVYFHHMIYASVNNPVYKLLNCIHARRTRYELHADS